MDVNAVDENEVDVRLDEARKGGVQDQTGGVDVDADAVCEHPAEDTEKVKGAEGADVLDVDRTEP